MPDIIPWMRYENASTAITWLCEVFGCHEHFVVRDESGGIAHAQLTLGSGSPHVGMIMVGEIRDDDLGVRTPAQAGCVTQGLYAVVDDIEAAYRRAKDGGAEIVTELTTTDYGSTDFAARDIGGHLWNFGTYRPSAEPADSA